MAKPQGRRPGGQSQKSQKRPGPRPQRPGKRGSGKTAPEDPKTEMRQVAGDRADKVHAQLMDAAEAFEADRFKDARRILRPLAERYPDAASVHELYGLTLYRLGEYDKAIEHLTAFERKARSTEQHPPLMDCYRALGDWNQVDALWDELRDASPSGALVTEGRIVMAGALADQGKLADAVKLLERGPVEPKRPKAHHLRLWYALADLQERAGNLPRARALFEQVRRRDASFADVAERLVGLG